MSSDNTYPYWRFQLGRWTAGVFVGWDAEHGTAAAIRLPMVEVGVAIGDAGKSMLAWVVLWPLLLALKLPSIQQRIREARIRQRVLRDTEYERQMLPGIKYHQNGKPITLRQVIAIRTREALADSRNEEGTNDDE